MSSGFWIAFAVLVLLFGWTLRRVRTRYEEGVRLDLLTVALTWIVYLAHLTLTSFAVVEAPFRWEQMPWISFLVGWCAILLGVGLAGWGVFSLGSLRRMSGRDTSTLVTSGAYRVSRNPQNLGWGLVLVGLAMAGRSPIGVALAGLFWIGFHVYVPLEEQYLEDVHGEHYRTYRSRVDRYLGRKR